MPHKLKVYSSNKKLLMLIWFLINMNWRPMKLISMKSCEGFMEFFIHAAYAGSQVIVFVSLNLTDDKTTSVQITAWCSQATSHYLSEYLINYMSPYGITRLQWVSIIYFHASNYWVVCMFLPFHWLYYLSLGAGGVGRGLGGGGGGHSHQLPYGGGGGWGGGGGVPLYRVDIDRPVSLQ